MTTFDNRERAYEAKYAQDAELRFKVEAKRNRIVAAWAAQLLEKSADEYTKELIKADLTEKGDEDVVRKLLADLGSLASETDIRAKIQEALAEALAYFSGKD